MEPHKPAPPVITTVGIAIAVVRFAVGIALGYGVGKTRRG